MLFGFFTVQQTHLGGVLILLKLHGDILDVRLKLGAHDIFQRVDAAAGLFYLLREKLHGLFHLRQLQHILKHLGQLIQRVVQLAGGLRKAVGVYLAGVVALGLEGVNGNVDAHDIPELHAQLHALAGVEKRLLKHFGRHDGACHLKRAEGCRQPLLDAVAKLLVELDDVHELTHKLVALILEELVAAPGGLETALELVEHHSGRGYRLTCQKVSPP